MADETLRFDIVGDDRASGAFSAAGASAGEMSRHMDAAARQAAILDEALKRQGTAARVSVDATLALARADKILEDAEHGLRDGALEAEFALKKQADAAKQSGRAADEAAAKNAAFRKSLSGLSINPGLLGPALALVPALTTVAGVAAGAAVGIAGAFTAGAGALAAFGAVAKPVLSAALTAEQAVQTAQDNYSAAIAGGTKQAVAYKAEQIAISKAYSELSPAQIALSKQLGDMANAWQTVKAAQTPVVAGALQPWLKSVTDLTGKLGPIIAKVSPVIRDLGVQFGTLINSPQFTAFRDFIANTGSNTVAAAGGTLIDLIDAFITLLPKFNPLIEKAVGWIGDLGPAVLKWSSSQKAADDITRFMAWFSANGPVVGGLLKNIGGALKALAPGLTAGGTLELKLISDFFGFVAKLPASIAKPLADVAGTLLILNKLGVFSVGVKIVGAAAKWLTGGVVNLGGGAAAGAEIRAAMVSGGTAAAAEIRAAMASGGAVAGTEEAGAVAGGAATAGRTFGTAAGAVLGPLLIAAVAYEGAKIGQSILSYFKNPGGAGQALTPGGTPPGAFTTLVPQGVVNQANAQNAAAAASPQGQGVSNLLAQGKAAQAYAVALQGLNAIFATQVKAAGTAMAAISTYTASVKASGTASLASKTDAAMLTADLTNVGVKSSTAQRDVAAYTKAIQQNGINSSQAAGARLQLVKDILNASTNARQGKTDLANYTTQVQDNGVKSQSAQGARTKLINDLIASGVDSRTAAGLVDGLGKSIKNLPAGKNINISMTGTGKYSITQTATQAAAAGGQQLGAGGAPARALGGMITGGVPGRDSVLINAMPGEVVVPTHMVNAGAVDHLRGRLPGFASGGMVGNLTPAYISGMSDTFTKDMTDAMVAAMRAAIRAAAAAAQAAAASAGGASAGMGGVSNASGVAALKSAAAKHGWTSAAEWNALNYVEMREAGYSLTATNPSSGAYGMAQFINGPSEYAQYGGNSTTYAGQATAMANYIAQRYGDPIAAAAHERAFNWYGSGLDAMFSRPTLIGVGERGPERVQVTPGGGSGGDLVAEVRALRAELRHLTGVAGAIPRATGQHVGAVVNGVAAQGSFGRRYP